jgi:hypothetical protein
VQPPAKPVRGLHQTTLADGYGADGERHWIYVNNYHQFTLESGLNNILVSLFIRALPLGTAMSMLCLQHLKTFITGNDDAEGLEQGIGR